MMFCIVRGRRGKEEQDVQESGRAASELRDRQFKNEQGPVAACAGLLELVRMVSGQIAIYLDP
jgi:hypothetical protein